MIEQEVMNFIKQFAEVKDFFLYGYCYWFAMILKKRFGGTIYYMPIKNHFIVRIYNTYYDANGRVIPDEDVYPWGAYKYDNPIESERIIRDCINKTE